MSAINTSMISMFTAAAILAAFRLPALIMMRGGMPTPFRRPVMIVKKPISRSLPIVHPLAQPFENMLPSYYPLRKPPLHSHSMPSNKDFRLPLPFYPYSPDNRVQQMQPYIEPKSTTTSKTTPKPIYNHQLFDQSNYFDTTTTYRPQQHPHHHYQHQQRSQSNSYKRNYRPTIATKYLTTYKRTTTPSYSNVRSSYNSGANEEHKYPLYPIIPRNYRRDDPQQTSPRSTTIYTTSSHIYVTESTSSTTTVRPKTWTITKGTVKPIFRLLTERTNNRNNSVLYYYKPIKLKQTNPTTIPTLIMKTRVNNRNKYLPKTSTTTTTTTSAEIYAMTPAPIQNYKPVKARIPSKDKDKEIQLMFDDTKNSYYFVTKPTNFIRTKYSVRTETSYSV